MQPMIHTATAHLLALGACFRDFTNRSAKPLEAGRYDALCTCFTSCDWINVENFAAVNYSPLSVTTCFVRPNMCLSTAVVFWEVVWVTSGHLDLASTNTRNMKPWNDPAKSGWTHCQALVDHTPGVECSCLWGTLYRLT